MKHGWLPWWKITQAFWCLPFLKLTYEDRRFPVISWRQNRLYATFLGVRPVDSVIVGKVDWQASGPTQAVSHQDFSLLAVQPRTLDLGCVSAVCPVQHPAQKSRAHFWSLVCCCCFSNFLWGLTNFFDVSYTHVIRSGKGSKWLSATPAFHVCGSKNIDTEHVIWL